MLTTGVDVFAGAAGNDSFNGILATTASTLNSFDNVNGGAGTDTLNVAATGLAAPFTLPASTTIAGMEIVNISNAGTTGTNAVTVTNTTFGTGVQKLNWVEAGAGTTAAVAVTLASATDVSVVSTGVTFTTAAITDTSTTVASTGSTLKNITLTQVNGAQTLTGNAIATLNLNTQAGGVATVTAAAGARELTVNTAGTGNITGVTDATATTLTLKNTGIQTLGTFTAAAATTVNVDTTAAATALVITAAAATKLNVSGTATVAAVITGSTALTEINISGAGAGLTSVVDLSGIATGLTAITSTATSATATAAGNTLGATTVTAGFGNNVTFTGGAGNDTITVGATTKAINVGAGTNNVYLVAGTTVLGVGGSITATTGTTDTLSLANADAVTLSTTGSAAFKAAVTGFETLNIGTATATNVSMTAFGAFDKVAFTAAAVAATLTGVTTGKTLDATFGAALTSMTTNALTGAADTMTVRLLGDLSGAGRAFGTFVTPGVENVTITTVDSNTTHAAQLATVTLTDSEATSIVVTGNNGLALSFTGTALNTFNAGGLTKGAVTYTASALTTDVVVAGSAVGNDTLDFNAALGKVTMTVAGGTNALTGSTVNVNTITGGTGNDTITGGNLADTIVGGAGTDRILSGTGADTLTGGAGVDTFVMSGTVATLFTNSLATTAGMDRITDFVAGTDKIALVNTSAVTSVVVTAVTVATAADVATLLTAIGNQVALTTGAAEQVGLITVTAGAMAGTYVFMNDTANAASATDSLINLTGVSGTITAADFVFA
jgi:S-layer protein